MDLSFQRPFQTAVYKTPVQGNLDKPAIPAKHGRPAVPAVNSTPQALGTPRDWVGPKVGESPGFTFFGKQITFTRDIANFIANDLNKIASLKPSERVEIQTELFNNLVGTTALAEGGILATAAISAIATGGATTPIAFALLSKIALVDGVIIGGGALAAGVGGVAGFFSDFGNNINKIAIGLEKGIIDFFQGNGSIHSGIKYLSDMLNNNTAINILGLAENMLKIPSTSIIDWLAGFGDRQQTEQAEKATQVPDKK